MTKTPVNYSTWYSKQDASSKIGVSTKTIEQYAKDGKIQQALWRRPRGGPRVAVYAPDDVDRLAAERRDESERPFIVPPATGLATNGNGGDAIARVRSNGRDGAALLQAMIQTIQKASESSEKLFLTIPEAAEFSGLSEAYIRRACQTQTLAAIRDGGWKIKRSALLAL